MTVHCRPWWRELGLDRNDPNEDDAGQARDHRWWVNAVIYQLTPWSFQDSDGDGIGDLPGVIRRLDYITSLGVDAVWLTPIFGSPMDDLGYDVTDFEKVAPLFGGDAAFERLLLLAHQRGLRVILDMVWNHTSDRHAWFVESRASRDNPKADWYVWADPGADGGPPNNWLSSFSGESAWIWEAARGQYYLANFLPSQPDLNWYNPDVRDAVLAQARFWLERGIDGMRLDAVNFFCHDRSLADNPMREGDCLPDGISPDNPLTRQRFVNSFCRPETLDYLAPLRRLADEYPGVALLGEVIEAEDSVRLAADYTAGRERLHLAYHGALLFDARMEAVHMRRILDRVLDAFGDRGACWIAGNHDFGRLHSQWNARDQDYPGDFHRMMALLLVCLPGAFCLWQGDELGLTEARIPEDIPPEALKDPFGRRMYPRLKGRDGARTPMPWDDGAAHCGFTTGDAPWLPIPRAHAARSVARQASDPQSTLNHWRQVLHWRRKQPALREGTTRVLDLAPPLFGFLREGAGQRLLCVFNMDGRAVRIDPARLGPLRCLNAIDGTPREDPFLLPPWGWLCAEPEADAAVAA
ncbi:alpha-amylase family glycosyl hydrolase [Coralloluteibacterium thermophilus]|uniref:Alpha-amylase family glycosyl hydrolase n=1 Tax=Coralloluteibacterium thermophilum TaxID=2707049 RepID=A0ABV9NIX2_9GAMM